MSLTDIFDGAPSTGPVRMADVARAAGVARVTVSRVLSDPQSVAPVTRAAVQAAIARLGYVPNLNAGTLASSRSRIVGGIVPSLSNSWFSETLGGLSEVLADAGYQLLIGQSLYNPIEEERLIDTFLGRRVDAMVLTGSQRTAATRTRLRAAGIPVVETWDITDDPLDMAVGFSHFAVGEAAAQYLLARGCRQLGFIGASEARALKRLAGFRAGMEKAGIDSRTLVLTEGRLPTSYDDGARGVVQLRTRQPALDGVFCSSDIVAAGALFECQRRGWRVPQDIAVMGFSDQPIAAAVSPSLTSVQVRARALGLQAGRMLLQRMGGVAEPDASRVADFGFQIVGRESA